MTAIQARRNLHKYIDRVDERFLNAIYAMVEEYLKNSFSEKKEDDYTQVGKPMSVETFRKRIRESKKQVASGEFITHDELLKEAEKW